MIPSRRFSARQNADPAATSDPQARARLAQALTQALAQAEAQTQAQEATAEQGQATPDAPEYDGASPVWVAVQALLSDESRNHGRFSLG